MNLSNQEIVEAGLESLNREYSNVITCFREVLRTSPQPELADILSEENSTCNASPEDVARVMSVAFQLLDMVEERVAHEARKVRNEKLGPTAEKGLWPHCLSTLADKGVSKSDLMATLKDVRVEPVFTAHPTEAKRPSVRERYRDVFHVLCKCNSPNLTPKEQKQATNEFITALEGLWYTGELRSEPPTVKRELRNVLYYLRHVFPDAITEVDQSFQDAWGYFTGKEGDRPPAEIGNPRINFGLWIGGDRDGHPFVTSDVTANTIAELRLQAVKLYSKELAEIAAHFSIGTTVVGTPQKLTDRVEQLITELGSQGESICQRNPGEPWRAFCYLLRAQLEHTDVNTFKENIEILHASLCEIGAKRMAQQWVAPLLRKIEVFGFHLASLDMRQNSDFHDQAAAQLFSAAGIDDGENFGSWPEEKRLKFLNKQLESNRPLLHPDRISGDQAKEVISSLNVFAKHWHQHGNNSGLGALIVSMTRQVSDLLLVHLFAREAGLTVQNNGKESCPIAIVPLFEKLEDLEQAANIIDQYLSHPTVVNSIATRAALNGNRNQQIMLGYSDSNKDAGILASQWVLKTSQQQITEVAEKHNVSVRFFHGKGGTVSRGAGPTNWFLRSLPHGSLHGDFRLTEQGETIAKKYAYPENATYHLETLVACVTRASALHRSTDPPVDKGIGSIGKLAEWSHKTYRELLETDDFITFFREATPIDALERIQIGSRPSRRTGSYTLDDLRAIPWVFSWTQSRFYLPGWYGVGSALEKLKNSCPEEYQELSDNIHTSDLPRYIFTSIETNLLSADLELMKQYCELVNDPKIRDHFFGMVEKELTLTKTHLSNLFSSPIAERRPRYVKTLSFRKKPLHDLHQQQIEMLKQWRSEDSDELPLPLTLNISAIASGLRSTG